MAVFGRLLTLILMSSLLSACGSLNNIYWKNGLKGGGEVVTVDAKQRHTFIFPDPLQQGRWNVCAEASPDVFSANSTALAAALSVNNTNRDGSFSFSNTEAVAAIGRTQYVNAIRESMYRTCERYLNGALSKSTFVVQAARDQRMMIALLAIEQLTGANRTQTTIVSGPAGSVGLGGALVDNEKTADVIVSREARVTKTEKDRDTAAAEFKTAKENYDCVAKTEVDADSASEAKRQTCIKAKADYELKQKHYDDAKSLFVGLNETLGKLGSSASATSGTSNNQIGNEGSNWQQGQQLTNVAVIAKAVVDITNQPPIDEALMFCLSQLDNSEVTENLLLDYDPPPPGILRQTVKRTPFLDDRIMETCLEVIKTRSISDEMIRNSKFTVEQQVDINERIQGYDDFRAKILNHLQSLDSDASVKKFMKSFEENLNKERGLSAENYQYLLANSCQTKDQCIRSISGNVYAIPFDYNKAAFNAALKAAIS